MVSHTQGICIIVLIVALSLTIVVAQAPDTLWTKAYGGTNGNYAWSIQETSDHGFIIAGWSFSYGSGDLYLVRIDSIGDTLWTRHFGGDRSDSGSDVKQTFDNGFVAVGCYQWDIGDYRAYIVRTDADGDSLWTKMYGNEITACARAVDMTEDQGFIIGGYRNDYHTVDWDIWILRTDSLGDTLWTRRYDFTNLDDAWDIKVLPGGYIVVTGFVSVSGSRDAFLMKMTPDGDSLWTQFYGGPDNELISSVTPTYDGGYILSGYTCSYGAGMHDIWIVKTDSIGDTLWTRTYGGPFVDTGFEIIQTSDSNYCLAIGTEIYYDSTAACIMKINQMGDSLWSYLLWGMGQAHATCIQQCHDDGYIVAGDTRVVGSYDAIYAIRLGTDQYISEESHRRVTWSLRNTICAGPLIIPNLMSFKIFDIAGREIHTINPAPGIYFIEVDGKITQKVIKIK